MIGYYPVRVLPSKTAILPVNPTFLPRVKKQEVPFFSTCIIVHSFITKIDGFHCFLWCFIQSEDEREMCTRTIYCTNVDKNVNTFSRYIAFAHLFSVLRDSYKLQATEDDVKTFFQSACGEVSLESKNLYFLLS